MTAVIRDIASCAQPSAGPPRCPPNAASSGLMSGTLLSARAPGSSRKIVLPSLTVSVTLMSAMVVGSTAVGSFERMAKSASRCLTHWVAHEPGPFQHRFDLAVSRRRTRASGAASEPGSVPDRTLLRPPRPCACSYFCRYSRTFAAVALPTMGSRKAHLSDLLPMCPERTRWKRWPGTESNHRQTGKGLKLGRPNRHARPSPSRTGSAKAVPNFGAPQHAQRLSGIATELFPNCGPNASRAWCATGLTALVSRGSRCHPQSRVGRPVGPQGYAGTPVTQAMTRVVLPQMLSHQEPSLRGPPA